MNKNIYSILFINSPKLETTHMLISNRINRTCFIHMREYYKYSNTNTKTIVTMTSSNNTDKSYKYNFKQKKPIKKACFIV